MYLRSHGNQDKYYVNKGNQWNGASQGDYRNQGNHGKQGNW